MSARVRIGAVRLKGGAHVHVLHNDLPRRVVDQMLQDVRKVIDNRGSRMAGYAIVAWDYRGGSTVAEWTAAGIVPSLQVPEFVKQALINRAIRNDAWDDIVGRPPEDKPA